MLVNLIAFITLMSLGLIVYHHVGYPLLLRFLVRQNQSNGEASCKQQENHHLIESLPSMTLVMPAYNEASWIQSKILNIAALQYPKDKLKVLIYCDGCTDNTAQLAQAALALPECRHLNVELNVDPLNRGKVFRLNQALKRCQTELIGFTDVSALMSIDSLSNAARQFSSPDVSVVNSCYQLLKPGSDGEAAYWRYQKKIKLAEEQLGGPIGAHGALYFIRNSGDVVLDGDTINDDFVLPMSLIAQGGRAAQARDINAIELEPTATEQDLMRRKRLGAGNFQQLIRLYTLLHPKFGKKAFAFASGKALRPLMPLLAIVSLLGSLVLMTSSSVFLSLAIAQLLAYLLAFLCHSFPRHFKHRWFKALHYIVAGHFFSFIGAIHYLFRPSFSCKQA